MKKVFLFLITGLVCTVGMTSCNEDDKEPGNVPLTGIEVDPASVEVDVRNGPVEVTNVKVYPVPANATGVDFKWESRDTSVATVTYSIEEDSKITIRREGSTVIVIRSGEVQKEIEVTGSISVTPLTGIRLTVADQEPPLVLHVGETVTVIAIPEPVNANTATSDTVTFVWESSDENVATVDQNGKVTITGTGKAKITVSCEEYKDISEDIDVEGI